MNSRNFAIGHSRTKANLNEIKKLKVLKQNLNNEETKLEYNNFKGELNDIYEEISNGTRKTSSLSKYFT